MRTSARSGAGRAASNYGEGSFLAVLADHPGTRTSIVLTMLSWVARRSAGSSIASGTGSAR